MPFKGLRDPKRRLAPVLSLDERRGLALAMLEDVLAALRANGRFECYWVVSPDTSALELAAAQGAEPLRQQGRPGYSAAAEQAAVRARAAGARGLLILPADLPLVTAVDLDALLAEAERSPIVLVPALDGRGTNALLTSPPGIISYHFGPDSFQAHTRASQQQRAGPAVLDLPAISLDVDQPSDLERLLARRRELDATLSGAYLGRIGALDRLARLSSNPAL